MYIYKQKKELFIFILILDLKIFKNFSLFDLIKNAILKILINLTFEFDDLSNNLPQLYLLKLIKMCFYYQILTVTEFNTIVSLIYDKLDVLTNLEILFSQKKDKGRSFERELVKIKQYLSEIFIMHIIIKNDEAAIQFCKCSTELTNFFFSLTENKWYLF